MAKASVRNEPYIVLELSLQEASVLRAVFQLVGGPAESTHRGITDAVDDVLANYVGIDEGYGINGGVVFLTEEECHGYEADAEDFDEEFSKPIKKKRI